MAAAAAEKKAVYMCDAAHTRREGVNKCVSSVARASGVALACVCLDLWAAKVRYLNYSFVTRGGAHTCSSMFSFFWETEIQAVTHHPPSIIKKHIAYYEFYIDKE